jgi:hypothetical protein
MAHLCRAGGRGHHGPDALRSGGRRRVAAFGVAAAIGLLATACVSAPPAGAPLVGRNRFDLDHDAFAFANLVRAERPGWNDAFANYCLVIARAASQFYRFARFAPDRPAASPEEYDRLVRAVLARPLWSPPLTEAERVVIPGYPDLHSFSAAHEQVIKAAFGSSILSMMHMRTWRVGVDFPPEHQERLARELIDEVDAGRPVPLMITNFPHEDLLNHSVLVYDHRLAQQGMDFVAYDPNDPGTPMTLYYDAGARAFWVGPLTYSPPGRVRAFRLYTSPLF